VGGFCSAIPSQIASLSFRKLIIIAPQNRSFRGSLSDHPPRRRKLLLRWTAPQALQSLPLHKKFYAHKNTKKNCIKHQNRIKEFLPKTGCVRMFILTENQFSSCALSQEEVDLQEYHVGSKDLVTP
jgi:CRISPR/Cas system-associated protein endoribonuclease Cas2